jgi:hypothetical protein
MRFSVVRIKPLRSAFLSRANVAGGTVPKYIDFLASEGDTIPFAEGLGSESQEARQVGSHQ